MRTLSGLSTTIGYCPAGRGDEIARVCLLVVERHASVLEREPELAAGLGEGLAITEVNLN